MLLPRLQPPLRAALTSIARSGSQSTSVHEAFAQLAIRSPALGFVRHASHAQQGAVNKAKDGPGKRLGAKKSGGNIIFRQRGTHWFPGDNCAMGRDHTIYATEAGYVKYYKDPEKHPKRQYIGVVFERAQVLPLPRNSMRRRKLNMVASTMEVEAPPKVEVKGDLVIEGDGSKGVSVRQTPSKERKGEEGRDLKIRPGYMYREANWEIGRAAERAKVKVREFKPRDRWTAWRKAWKRKVANKEKRIVGKRRK
ncbi:54S ribosomal protein L2 [Lachnellula suecica]|uniref:Large ribosomal subunit protein bL27m n=1 Tax=Lachnellula suecica TaxID=602035 RepID=A0A8T9CIY8_9HELO|nr:54S ribosomal protein L2 [Lachnellula suecica]